jgi:hypothetical protein
MTRSEIDKLRTWKFVDLLRNNMTLYEGIYKKVFNSIKQTTNREPTIADMKDGISSALLYERFFMYHCASHSHYNPNWEELCSKEFADYIIFMFYNVP